MSRLIADTRIQPRDTGETPCRGREIPALFVRPISIAVAELDDDAISSRSVR